MAAALKPLPFVPAVLTYGGHEYGCPLQSRCSTARHDLLYKGHMRLNMMWSLLIVSRIVQVREDKSSEDASGPDVIVSLYHAQTRKT
jgi:hypothetical protein